MYIKYRVYLNFLKRLNVLKGYFHSHVSQQYIVIVTWAKQIGGYKLQKEKD